MIGVATHNHSRFIKSQSGTFFTNFLNVGHVLGQRVETPFIWVKQGEHQRAPPLSPKNIPLSAMQN